MYGFVNHALELLVVRRFGQEKWKEIKLKAGVDVGQFLLRHVYEDGKTYDLVGAACAVLNVGASDLLEMFGEMFFDFCQESGYDRILQVLGGTLRDFLQNLDALHDHLGTIYPGMEAPSFRVTHREGDDDLILHYYSDRPGLEHIVIGIVKTVARKIHNTEVEVKVLQQKDDDTDHIQFVIIEKGRKGEEDENENEQVMSVQGRHQLNMGLSTDPKISPATFCRVFPFHVMFDRDLKIIQVGTTVSRVIPEISNPNACLTDLFELLRPQMSFDFDLILDHINTVFVLKTKEGVMMGDEGSDPKTPTTPDSPTASDEDSLRLKGQMVHLPETGSMLFLCSPSVGNLDDLQMRGLYLSDIPVHDATRNLLLLSQQFKAEYQLTQQLEVLNDQLRQTFKELEGEKKLTDQLLFSVLPPSVANELRQGRPVKAEKFEMITIMFSGIVDFAGICKRFSPMEIVQLLNDLYSNFDWLLDKFHKNVFKVETVGDKYMAVSGLPQRNENHAFYICNMALDMMDVTDSVECGGIKIQLKIGIHSGEVVAGVVGHKTPRYCLFGNTVNLTSRTETTGKAGRINITEYTYRCLPKDNPDSPLVLEERGPVAMKGRKEPMITYFLTRNPNHKGNVPQQQQKETSEAAKQQQVMASMASMKSCPLMGHGCPIMKHALSNSNSSSGRQTPTQEFRQQQRSNTQGTLDAAAKKLETT